jgi:hypothetical protein
MPGSKILRESNVTERSLITRCQVSDLKVRSDNNPQGFLIRNFEIIENRISIKLTVNEKASFSQMADLFESLAGNAV